MADDSSNIDGHAAAADDSQKHIFPFFKLPRELRDEIYDLSLDRHGAQLSCSLHIVATDIAFSKLLLVSKVFKDEYQERATKLSKLVISDDELWETSTKVKLPPAATRLPRVHLNLIFAQSSEIAAHLSWMGGFKCLSRLSIRIHMSDHFGYRLSVRKSQANLEDWTRLRGLEELKVYDRECKDVWKFTGEHGLCFEWSKDSGKIEHVPGGYEAHSSDSDSDTDDEEEN